MKAKLASRPSTRTSAASSSIAASSPSANRIRTVAAGAHGAANRSRQPPVEMSAETASPTVAAGLHPRGERERRARGAAALAEPEAVNREYAAADLGERLAALLVERGDRDVDVVLVELDHLAVERGHGARQLEPAARALAQHGRRRRRIGSRPDHLLIGSAGCDRSLRAGARPRPYAGARAARSRSIGCAPKGHSAETAGRSTGSEA